MKKSHRVAFVDTTKSDLWPAVRPITENSNEVQLIGVWGAKAKIVSVQRGGDYSAARQ